MRCTLRKILCTKGIVRVRERIVRYIVGNTQFGTRTISVAEAEMRYVMGMICGKFSADRRS